ncbi:MAG TPA: hypothetical protein VK638_25645 [Edaphobacter sp.]|nr:hypothetical protein [Edaphobacter sp.]
MCSKGDGFVGELDRIRQLAEDEAELCADDDLRCDRLKLTCLDDQFSAPGPIADTGHWQG